MDLETFLARRGPVPTPDQVGASVPRLTTTDHDHAAYLLGPTASPRSNDAPPQLPRPKGQSRE
ncbi:hypothetical protein OG607_11265 [Streptomyces sp. NBC_01537]|uniref:hypothetical protein n=1 Tax=Streptomyces sp. NBC_01537 TaxID=2903896 RepID=UPI00386556D8